MDDEEELESLNNEEEEQLGKVVCEWGSLRDIGSCSFILWYTLIITYMTESEVYTF